MRPIDSLPDKSILPQLDNLPLEMAQFLRVISVTTGVCLLVELFCGRYLHLGYPYNWPLLFPHVSFMDFRWYFQHFSTLHTNAFFQGPDIIMYPAPVVMCYWFFYRFQPRATEVFLVFILLTSFIAAILLARAFVRRRLAPRKAGLFVGITYLLSYSLWFEFKQANMEIIVWVLISLGLFAFAKKRSWTAAAMFGLVGAMKFYPLIYLGLLLAKKKYRECVFGCAVAGAAILLSLWLLGPTVTEALRGTQHNLEVFRTDFMLSTRPNEIGFDHSLFALIKCMLVFGKRFGVIPSLTTPARSILLSTYLAIAAITGTAIYFLRIRFLPFANQVLCISIASIVLPPVSYDYTVIHLYTSLALLSFLAIRSALQGIKLKGLQAIFLCVAFAVSPFSELILEHERVGGELRCLVLLTIFVMALLFPLENPEFDASPRTLPADPAMASASL